MGYTLIFILGQPKMTGLKVPAVKRFHSVGCFTSYLFALSQAFVLAFNVAKFIVGFYVGFQSYLWS